MNISEDKVVYIVRCNSFEDAARYAAQQDWHLSEWTWMPYMSLHNDIWVYERVNNA